jgi:hypothetical protein
MAEIVLTCIGIKQHSLNNCITKENKLKKKEQQASNFNEIEMAKS